MALCFVQNFLSAKLMSLREAAVDFLRTIFSTVSQFVSLFRLDCFPRQVAEEVERGFIFLSDYLEEAVVRGACSFSGILINSSNVFTYSQYLLLLRYLFNV